MSATEVPANATSHDRDALPDFAGGSHEHREAAKLRPRCRGRRPTNLNDYEDDGVDFDVERCLSIERFLSRVDSDFTECAKGRLFSKAT